LNEGNNNKIKKFLIFKAFPFLTFRSYVNMLVQIKWRIIVLHFASKVMMPTQKYWYPTAEKQLTEFVKSLNIAKTYLVAAKIIKKIKIHQPRIHQPRIHQPRIHQPRIHQS
jgi:hypothetical protein